MTRRVLTRLAPDTVPGMSALHGRIVAETERAVSVTAGPDAGASLAVHGLGAFHSVVDAIDVGAIREHVLETLRPDLLRLATAIGRSVMQWGDDFYVDDYLILRINYPYEVALGADPRAENPGIGRLSPAVRSLAQQRKTTDTTYAPKTYHHNQPPASWAHGPHIDSWAGHSRDGVNLWWAITPVPAEAGVVLYPELAERQLRCDRRSLYLAPGYRLPTPTFVSLAAGEMLVFDPEFLHGTRLNTTTSTRVAFSARLNPRQPVFDAACFYAREFWHRAENIEAGHFDRVIHLPREHHLAPASEVAPEPPDPVPTVRLGVACSPGPVRVCDRTMLPIGQRLVVEFADRRILMVNGDLGVRAFDTVCPHVGADLTDGAVDGETLFCPGHAVAFNLRDGSSPCASLALDLWDVAEEGSEWILMVPERSASRS